MEREKPELLTRGDVFMDYYFMELIEEQRGESRRKLLEEQRKGEKEQLLKTIEVGKIIKGD